MFRIYVCLCVCVCLSLYGIDWQSNRTKISCAVYPNPTSQTMHISFELEKNSTVRIQLISNEGKLVREVLNSILQSGEHLQTINLEDLAHGKYNLLFNVGGSIHTEPFIIE